MYQMNNRSLPYDQGLLTIPLLKKRKSFGTEKDLYDTSTQNNLN